MKIKIALAFSFSLLTGCVMAPATQTAQTTMPQTTGTTQTAQAMQTAQTVALVELLMQQLGITQTQAQGGAGALFQVAKTQMQPGTFSQLEQSVPGMGSMLGAAGASQQSSGMDGLSSMVALASAFQQQGLSPNMIPQFIPIVIQYVANTGGSTLANSLSSALVGR